MPVRTTITSGDRAIPSLSSLIPMLIICCSGGTVGSVYTFEPGDDVSGSLGGGIGSDAVYAALRGCGATVRCVVAEPTWSANTTILHTGTGPNISVATTDDQPGDFDDHSFLLTVTNGGAAEDGAAFSVAYDGATVVETVPVPAELPAELTGNVDITNGAVLTTYAAGVFAGLHLDFTAPTADVLTFPVSSTLPASLAGVKAATATVAAPVTLVPADLIAAGLTVMLAHPRKLLFTTAGVTPSDAPSKVTITGTRYGVDLTEELNLSQVAGTVASVNAYDVITTLVYPAADGIAATVAIGYSDAYATGAQIVTKANELAAAAGLTGTFSLTSTATAQYLTFTSDGLGVGTSATIDDAASTADTALGFSSGAGNLTTTGHAAKWSPAWTGKTFTFPATSDYVAGDTYTVTSTGPRASLASIVDAAVAAHDNYLNAPFGFLVVAQPAPDAATCKATNAALAALTNGTWTPDPYAPIFVTSCVGGPFHTASATLATNNANITTTDNAMLAAFGSASANLDSVAVDDIYITGSPALVNGAFRRTAALAWCVKASNKPKIAADVADGLMPDGLGSSLLGPDGLTRARDASKQAIHMENNLGFSCLRSTSAGLGYVKFAPGYTRAGATSRLRFEGVVAIALTAATIGFGVVERWEGLTAQANPLTGQLSDQSKKAFHDELYAAEAPTLLPSGGLANVSDFEIEILDPSTGRTVDNGEVRVKITLYVLAEIITVYLNISASGVVTTIAA